MSSREKRRREKSAGAVSLMSDPAVGDLMNDMAGAYAISCINAPNSSGSSAIPGNRTRTAAPSRCQCPRMIASWRPTEALSAPAERACSGTVTDQSERVDDFETPGS